jgi:D-glycero-D-manno-heptose 1,7-bisphosphate phosphatase
VAVSGGGRRRAVFLDKDGTLVADVPYNVDPARILFLSGVMEGLRRLQAAGYVLAVVSNQPGVALGFFDAAALGRVEDAMREAVASAGAALTGFYWCPHHPAGHVAAYACACECRKPMPGLLHAAARDLDIDLAGSWMVGDILDDVEAGRRAGCRTVLVNNGNETEWRWSAERTPDHVARDFSDASIGIVRDAPARGRVGRLASMSRLGHG